MYYSVKLSCTHFSGCFLYFLCPAPFSSDRLCCLGASSRGGWDRHPPAGSAPTKIWFVPSFFLLFFLSESFRLKIATELWFCRNLAQQSVFPIILNCFLPALAFRSRILDEISSVALPTLIPSRWNPSVDYCGFVVMVAIASWVFLCHWIDGFWIFICHMPMEPLVHSSPASLIAEPVRSCSAESSIWANSCCYHKPFSRICLFTVLSRCAEPIDC